jgi:hypothetical protein
MSSTKIVIVVLVLIAVLFVVFVLTGALSDDQPKAGNKNDAVDFSKKGKTPGWSKAIGDLASSFKPKVELQKKIYSESAEETIGPDEKQPFRTATFRLLKGKALIEYEDNTEDAIDELKEQECELPNPDTDDPKRGSIVALKQGGKLSFSCRGTDPCRVEVE